MSEAYTGQSTDAAEAAAREMNKAAEIKRSKGPKVWMANAIGVNPRPFVEARRKMHKDQNDVLQHGERLLKDPKNGYHYVWARLNEPVTVQRIGAGLYRYVEPKEIKSELAAMFTTHNGTANNKVCYGSLVLCECPHSAYVQCFVEPEIESVARMAAQEEYFQAEIEEASKGHAQGTVEQDEEKVVLAPSSE